jgi:hypothetical protein
MEPRRPPRRPGFVVKGSLAVVLMAGVALFLGSCALGLVASATGSDGLAGLGFCLSGAGVIAVVVALLVAAARREGPRI